jgi:hypothetical protein
MAMPIRLSLVVLYLISVPISDLTAFDNGDLIVFSSSIAAARSYTSSIYIVLDL